ncbi:MAG: lipase family protein [Nitrospirae bacterium]|nr:MAG: lipase family protein [Nitrospirota bacterium]
MQFDNSWDALMKPGQATTYFDLDPLPPWQLSATRYSPKTAWWLAELSRLIYRQEKDELGSKAAPPTRNEILHRVGLEEVAFFNNGGMQGAVVRSQDTRRSFNVVVFRGTHDLRDWLTNLNTMPGPWKPGGKVHKGFKQGIDFVWADIVDTLDGLDGPTFYTGHSLGAALATLAASLRPPRALYTFGSPRVGNKAFAKTLDKVPVFRVVNNRDIVTTVPPDWPPFDYRHVGELRYIAHNDRMLVNPSSQSVAMDRLRRDASLARTTNAHRLFVDPPEPLADHAPVNYVAHLERLMAPSRSRRRHA